MSSPTSASASSCSIRGASWPKGHPTKSFVTRRCGRPISVVDPSLSIKGLRAGYGSLDILNGVDLEVPQGQFVALMGPNGAGKSTLLKSLYGMTTLKDGSIEWQGKNISGYKSRAILAEGISFVPQGRCNFPVMTIDENLQMAAYTLRDAQVKADRDYVYDLFPILKARRNTLAGNMSAPDQQLPDIAIPALHHPQIL